MILMNQYHCGIFITPLNSLWFPTTTESRCFDVPTPKNVCTYVLDFGCRASLRCHSTRGWIIFTDRGVNLLCFRRNIWELNLMRPELSPSCSHLGRRVVYSVTPLVFVFDHSDTFVISKYTWQIIWHMLQISHNLNLEFRFLSTWTKCLRHFLFIFWRSPWYSSPPNARKCSYCKSNQRIGCK